MAATSEAATGLVRKATSAHLTPAYDGVIGNDCALEDGNDAILNDVAVLGTVSFLDSCIILDADIEANGRIVVNDSPLDVAAVACSSKLHFQQLPREMSCRMLAAQADGTLQQQNGLILTVYTFSLIARPLYCFVLDVQCSQ